MIEYRYKVCDASLPNGWRPMISAWAEPTPDLINSLDYKINDVVYTKWSNKLEEAIVWDKLQA